MRKVVITVHNNQKLEIFVQKLRGVLELWVVGMAKGNRMVLDHHLTHDDLEARLGYAKTGDLEWQDAVDSEIPVEKHGNAIEMEKTIKEGTFWDFEKLNQSITAHLLGSIGLFPLDKGAWNVANQTIFGRWTDGVATLSLEPNNKLGWSCTDQQHPLNVGARVHGHVPNWWNFTMWQLHLVNAEHKCGTRVGVLRVDGEELHLQAYNLHQVACVFQREQNLDKGDAH